MTLKLSCIKCGAELQVEFTLGLTKCSGYGIVIDVTCNNCEFPNHFRKLLEGDKINTTEKKKEYEERIKEDKKEQGRYFG